MRIFEKQAATGRAKPRRRRWSFEQLEDRLLLATDVVMFNDHIAGPATHPFTTSYSPIGVSSGPLRDSATGTNTAITLSTLSAGAVFEGVVGSPTPGTDAHAIFDGWADFSSQPGASIAVSGATVFTHSFTGLDPDRAYEFAGTAVRGNSGYTNRWTLVTLVGAESFTPAHSSGVGIITAGLPANQVAIWTGENHLANQGFVAQWTDIGPGADGAFQITSRQYLGLTPGVGTGDASSGSKGYALTAIRMTEHDPTFRVISSDPPSGALLTSAPTTYSVDFNLPIDATSVQASDLTVDGLPATAVEIIDDDTIQFVLPAVSGESFHSVAIAEGAIHSRDAGLPVAAYSASFAILTGAGIVINEVHYDPGSGAYPWEYIELFNAGSAAVDLSGWQIANAVSFTIPNGTILDSGEYLLISEHPSELADQYGVASLGPFDGGLSNQGETITLRDSAGVKQDEVAYMLGFPWPTIGDIPGHSIQLISPALDNGLGGNWRSAPVTPAAANAVLALNSPPQMRDVSHSSVAPVSGQDVAITVKATDPEGVASVTLEYQLVDPGDYIAINDPRYATQWTTLVMRDDGLSGDAVAGDNIYTAVLPGDVQAHRRLVRYRITAVDTLGASIAVPYADDPQPNFAYFVYDQTPAWTGAIQPEITPDVTYDSALLDSIPTYHLITTDQAHVDSQFIPDSTLSSGYTGSDYLWHGALVYDNVVYDHITFRARGGVWRYAMGKNMWKFDFNRGHNFQAHDIYGNPFDVTWRKLNLGANIQQGNFWHRGEQGLFESVGFKLFELAGVPASNTHYVHFRIITGADENGPDQYSGDFQGLYLAVEQIDGRFLDQHGLPDGNLYKMEAGTGVGGIGGELNNQGDYPAVTDSSDLIDFKTTYESGPQSADWWRENLNLESYYNYRSIVEAIHHYDVGAGKNYFYYLNPDTNQWETIPWDLDLTWADNMFGDGNEPFRSRVLAIPEFALDYRNRMREIRDLLFNVEQVGLLADEVASFVYTPGEPSWVDADRALWDYNPILASSYVNPSKAGHGRFYAGGPEIPATGSFAGMMQLVEDYAATRGAWIDANILTDESLTPAKPTISYTGAVDFPINQLQFSTSDFSSPGSSFAAMEWRIGEVYHPGTASYQPGTEWRYEIDAVWESGELSSFDSVIDVSGVGLRVDHTYRARVRMQDADGRWSHWSDPMEFVVAPPVGVPTLAITELHYNPAHASGLANKEDQEFIEIYNYGDQTVDLSGVQIADFASNPYVFDDGLSLAPGERIIVARSPVIFTSIHGTGINLAARGYANANLSNSGERVTLLDPNGSLILSFTYADSHPWPTAPDGYGPSLEIIDPLGDPSDPANWRASAFHGGSPGWDGVSSPLVAGDFDRSGDVDQQDHAVWKRQFGMSVPSPGAGADGNHDGIVDAADYTIWRDNLNATSVTPPPPTFSFDSLGHTYTQDFNDFRGTDDTLPDYFLLTAGGSNVYRGVFNSTTDVAAEFTGIMAATSDGSDFALSWRESTGAANLDDARFLFAFTNNTGQPISGFDVSYDVEAWVNGRRDNQLRFKYDVYADSPTAQAFAGRNAFETDIFATLNPNHTSIASNDDQFVLDGKATDNRVTVGGYVDLTTLLVNEGDPSAGVFGVLPPGETAYFRWQISNANLTAGNRSALAIDNFNITPLAGPSPGTATAVVALVEEPATSSFLRVAPRPWLDRAFANWASHPWSRLSASDPDRSPSQPATIAQFAADQLLLATLSRLAEFKSESHDNRSHPDHGRDASEGHGDRDDYFARLGEERFALGPQTATCLTSRIAVSKIASNSHEWTPAQSAE